MDPVFLCDKDQYIELCKDTNIDRKGIVAYILNPSDEKEKLIKHIANKRDMPYSVFVDRGMGQEAISELWNIEFDYNVKNEVWLKNFIESDFVITDSFHGMCMAIIFEKQFIVIHNSARGSTRFYSLLNLLNLQDRLFDSVTDYYNLEPCLKYIDYYSVNIILSKEKKRCMNWLQMHI